MHVPKVDLLDPDVEPTDEELEALMQAVAEEVCKQRDIANARLNSEMKTLTQTIISVASSAHGKRNS